MPKLIHPWPPWTCDDCISPKSLSPPPPPLSLTLSLTLSLSLSLTLSLSLSLSLSLYLIGCARELNGRGHSSGVERSLRMREVTGSNPVASTPFLLHFTKLLPSRTILFFFFLAPCLLFTSTFKRSNRTTFLSFYSSMQQQTRKNKCRISANACACLLQNFFSQDQRRMLFQTLSGSSRNWQKVGPFNFSSSPSCLKILVWRNNRVKKS